MTNLEMKTSEQTNTCDNVISLFTYLRELNKLKQQVITNIKDYPWHIMLSSLPSEDENLQIYYRDSIADKNNQVMNNAGILLAVSKPTFTRCPEPNKCIREWLEEGWTHYLNEVGYHETLVNSNNEEELFLSDSSRVEAYDDWLRCREAWAAKEKIKDKVNSLFNWLYKYYYELEKESESKEIILANGILVDKENPAIVHPILTQRVNIHFDPENDIIYIYDTDAEPELYMDIFQVMNGVNIDALSGVNEAQTKFGYNPLDRIDTPSFFKMLINSISSDGEYRNEPVSKELNSRFTLFFDPCYIVRKRLDGTIKAINLIIDSLKDGAHIPNPINDIVAGGRIDISEETEEMSIEERLAAVGGESPEILLAKEANKEQLEIARRIERYNAVLVQGPPGTGKTHTIANLMGHFLANGKSVLVTSHTKKALQVLKEKVPLGLQDLCVSMLDDSNVDMERSIDGITSRMAQTTSFELSKKMNTLKEERKKIISELAKVRGKLYAIKNKECNSIVYNGEGISPSNAAKFIKEGEQELSYIPGKVKMNAPLPLGIDRLSELYATNEILTPEDEKELDQGLPDIRRLLSPADYEQKLTQLKDLSQKKAVIETSNNWKIYDFPIERFVRVTDSEGTYTIEYSELENIVALREFTHNISPFEKWMNNAAVDGKNGGAYRQRWLTLIKQIQKTCKLHEEEVQQQFGVTVELQDSDFLQKAENTLKELRNIFAEKGKVGSISMFFHKEYSVVLDKIRINGEKVQSAKDCEIVLKKLELTRERNTCGAYWDELLVRNGVKSFKSLAADAPEEVAKNSIDVILQSLDWYENYFNKLILLMKQVNLPTERLFNTNAMDSDLAVIDKVLYAAKGVIPQLCEVLIILNEQQSIQSSIESVKQYLNSHPDIDNSKIWGILYAALNANDLEEYKIAYSKLINTNDKTAANNNRIRLLNELRKTAPDWADAISKREGIHGNAVLPTNIEDAWKWKQYNLIIEEIMAQPYAQLQAESIRLSKEYRTVTAKYAEACGWYHLLKRTEADISMKQDLQGWKLTVKKIGKGTGKRAPEHRAKARELMSRCQVAIPGWIMPINKALETLDPRTNKFDIIIIDEASQADVSSLAILYMGKKLIIVGDDKQVSPMAIGMDVDQMASLEQMYIKGKIPNSHLYTSKTSIYDIAATTFQPLMLREHFRCVPDIIGFSNMLSYDYKIKPLREAGSSNLLPAVVNYRVKDGKRQGKAKTNPKEAETIIALLKACMEQPEYDDKTFGIISLLGDEQVKLLQQKIEKLIEPKEIMNRRLLCGNPANFQGDERDVIFLSMVDSSEDDGPLNLMTYGPDDAYRKRYNVAVSRARDQLWVVDSLDSANDLKPGDIRKTLIDYSLNPKAHEQELAETTAYADSPFEVAVATALKDRGYHIVQQWKVGSYRLDMVAICGKNSVAIECDGERWHSGDEKIREDMERQTILERIGWRFIRIRGSEFYKDREATINRIITELHDYDINPEDSDLLNTQSCDTELLTRVKQRALEIMDLDDSSDYIDEETVAVALNSHKEMIIADPPEDAIKANITTNTTTDIVNYTQLQEATPKDIANQSTKPAREIVEQIVLPGLERFMPEGEPVIKMLIENGIDYVDKRKNNGALWVIGGEHDIDDIIKKATALGFTMHFKKGGGRVTKGKDAWWTK